MEKQKLVRASSSPSAKFEPSNSPHKKKGSKIMEPFEFVEYFVSTILTLGELEATAGFRLTIFLTLNHA